MTTIFQPQDHSQDHSIEAPADRRLVPMLSSLADSRLFPGWGPRV